MFTGIIEEIGVVAQIKRLIDGLEITIAAHEILSKLKVEDSVAIDGVCLTLVRKNPQGFTVQAVGETLNKTTLGQYTIGRKVNLESSLTLQSPLGGHLVLGHVNRTAVIRHWERRGENYYLETALPADLLRYCITEGSIAIDGISLTIARLKSAEIGISIIPYTVEHTNLQEKKIGDEVNIEIDVIPRYLEKLLPKAGTGTLTIDQLKKWGYE
jgi:riboflavin synthase